MIHRGQGESYKVFLTNKDLHKIFIKNNKNTLHIKKLSLRCVWFEERMQGKIYSPLHEIRYKICLVIFHPGKLFKKI